MSGKKCVILKMNDIGENYRISKEDTFDLPMRVLISGRSLLSGKTNTVGNIILRPVDKDDTSGAQFYSKEFKGENIYIVCPSTMVDYKWEVIIKGKQIPPTNIYTSYDEQELENLYDKLEKEFYQAKDDGRKPEHKLVIFDDCSYGGDLKHKINGIMAKFACNSRHFLISVLVTCQKFSDCPTSLRENASGMMLYAGTQKQMDLIYQDIGEMPKKEFLKMFRDATHERHSCLIVNYSNPPDRRFLNQYFEPIDLAQYER